MNNYHMNNNRNNMNQNNMNQMNINQNQNQNQNQTNNYQNNMNQINMNQINMNQNNMSQINNYQNNMNQNNMNQINMNQMSMFQMNMYQLFNNYMNPYSNISNQTMNNNYLMFQNNINNNINIENNNLDEGKYQESILPRNIIYSFDNPFRNERNIYNLIFKSNTDTRVNIQFPKNKTMSELFHFYAQKMGINENDLGKRIMFLYNAETLHENDQRQIKDIFQNLSIITVVDKYFIVGGNENYI